jgi:hypothetical protein
LSPEEIALAPTGINLLNVPLPVAQELFLFQQESGSLRSDVRAMDNLLADPTRLSYVLENRERSSRYFLEQVLGPEARPALVRKLSQVASASPNGDEFRSRLSALLAEA